MKQPTGNGWRCLAAATLLGTAACGGVLAYVAQSRLHLIVGQTPPQADAFWPAWLPAAGFLAEGSMRGVAMLYAVGALMMAGSLAAIGLMAGWHPMATPIHLGPEPAAQAAPGPTTARRAWQGWGGALAALSAMVLLYIYTIASARADLFPVLQYFPARRMDRMLAGFYRLLGLDARPNWWSPLVAWLGVVPLGALALALVARRLGWRWESTATTRRPWEWVVVGLVACVALVGFLHRIEDRPYVIQQDDGIGARFGHFIAAPQSRANVFANDWLPNVCVVPRGIATNLAGNHNPPLRYTSALVGAVALVAAWWCYRGLFGAGVSMVLLLLTASSAHFGHFARVGTMHIDSLLWIYILLAVWIRWEQSPAGARRLVLAWLAGATAGMTFALYPATQIGAVGVAMMVALRVMFQRDFWATRAVDVAVIALAAVMMMAPMRIIPGAKASRENEVYLLAHPILHYEFLKPEMQALGINNVHRLVLHHWINAMGVFHYKRDNSHNYSTPFPAASPTVAVLSAVGALLLLLRCRSWLAFLVLGWFLTGTFLGGAIRFGPYAPSSSRLLVLLPILFIAAGVTLDQAARGAWVVRQRMGVWTTLQRRGLAAAVIAGMVVVLGADWRLNRLMYERTVTDPTLMYNDWMGPSTQLQRLIESTTPKADYVYHIGAYGFADITFLHNDFLMPETIGRRWYLPEGMLPALADLPESGRIWFIVDKPRLRDFDTLRSQLKFSRVLRSEPLPFGWMPAVYTIFELDRGLAPPPEFSIH